jgi:hypothetical protein
MAQYRFATAVWPLGALATTVAAPPYGAVRDGRHRQLLVVVAVPVLLLSLLSLLSWSDRAAQFRARTTVSVCAIALNNTYADLIGVRDGTLLAVDGGGRV